MPFNIKFEDKILYLSGDLTIDNVMFVKERAAHYLQPGKDFLTIDCSAMQKIDTSALALMLDWQRSANQAKIKLNFCGLSKDLLALIEISGLNSFFA